MRFHIKTLMRAAAFSAALLPVAPGVPLSVSMSQPRDGDRDELRELSQQIKALYDQGAYAEAIPLAKRYAAARRARLGDAHPDYATALNNLGMLLKLDNRFAEAEPLMRRALAIKEKALGADHPDTAIAISNLGELLQALNRFAEAEPLMRRALRLKEKSLGADHPSVAVALNNLALLLHAANRVSEAEPMMRRALAIDEKRLGPDHPNVAIRLNNLAQFLQTTNRLDEAEPLVRRALNIKEKQFGPDHPSVAAAVNNLAELLEERSGPGEDSERLKRRSLAIYERSYGPAHPDVAAALNNLAALLENTGRRAEAEPLYRRALAIFEKAGGQSDPKTARALNNLAHLLKADGRLVEAEPLMRRALAIDEKIYGGAHPDVGRDLNNLAMLLQATGRAGEAEPIMRRALAIDERSLGPQHPQTATDLNNLASLLAGAGRGAEAEPIMRRALAIYEASYGPSHPALGAALSNLAVLRAERGDWTGALTDMRKASAIAVRRLQKANEKSQIKESVNQFGGHVAMAYRAAPADPAVLDEAFAMAQRALTTGAAGALAQAGARFAAGSGPQAQLVREQQDLARKRKAADQKLLAALGGADQRAAESLRTEISRLDAQIDAASAKMAQNFPAFAALTNPEPLSIQATQSLLSPDEVLIQFIDVQQIGSIPDTAFAFAVTRRDVRWVELPLARELASRTDALRCGLDASAWTDPSAWPESDDEERFHKEAQKQKLAHCRELTGLKTPEDDLPPFPLAQAHELYQALFGQIEDLIRDKQLLIAPSRALSRIPLQALVSQPPAADAKGFERYAAASWLGLRQAITVLPSAASLAALRKQANAAPSPAPARKPFIGFGNPLLEGSPEHPAHQARAAQARERQSCAANPVVAGLNSRKIHPNWPPISSLFRANLANVARLREQIPLPETADELCAVGRKFSAESDVWLGGRMTETNIKSLSAKGQLSSYRVIHFATHGLLSGDLKGLAEPALMFTPPAQATETDDGLLTASEAAQLKLDADWIVMSACNTAGAGIEGGEALSGLAQAFFYAGARSLLVSHWPVDSDAAVAITTGAFSAMRDDPSLGRAEALRRSLEILARAPSKSHPATWAPFVLVGEGGR